MNKEAVNEEKKNQNTTYESEVKVFTSTENNSIIKGAEALNNKTAEQPAGNPASSNTAVIPNEKKEQDRLKKMTGAYDLKKVEPLELQKHIKLKEKTPEDYYSNKLHYQELNKRLDNEAFGPKTDFSIWNFENNYDKLNNEEQSMMTYKMQREFNNLGYTDADGKELKTDGIFGNKTKSAYNKYTKVNKVDFEDYIKGNEEKDNDDDIYNAKEEHNYKALKYSGDNSSLFTKLGNVSESSGEQNTYNSKDTRNYVYNDKKTINSQANEKSTTQKADRDKEVLTKEDYERVQILKAIYNYAKYELKEDAIADSAHREAVIIRRQEKYSDYEDYGPERVKKFTPTKEYQYVGVEGYTDNDYTYSDTKDTATIYISKPLSSDEAEWEGGRYLGHISNANAITGEGSYLNYVAGAVDLVLSYVHPLYSKVREGDRIITIKKHKGGYTKTTEKEYKIYLDKQNNIYYVKK